MAFDLSTPAGRFTTYADFLWNDHAYLRLGFQNAHWISDELVRTNQPWPHQLAAWKAKGVKTVINLRGGAGSAQDLEREACERLDLALVTFRAGSREAPDRETVLGAQKLFETIAYPALMHCKSGADRAGVMSVLYMHFRRGQPIREAVRQLGLKYLHWPRGQTGVLDYTFETYLEAGEPAGMSFLEWVLSPHYDPEQLKAEYRRRRPRASVVEALLRRE
jgi:protein tyrosine/serine phosphatase